MRLVWLPDALDEELFGFEPYLRAYLAPIAILKLAGSLDIMPGSIYLCKALDSGKA